MIYALARDTIPVRENDVNYLYNVMAGEMLHGFLFFFFYPPMLNHLDGS